MTIKELKGGTSLESNKDNKIVIELNPKEVADIAHGLYKTMGKNETTKRLYSDFMVAHYLLESGKLDDWAIERIATHRGMTGIKQVDNDDPGYLPVEIIKK